MSMMTTTASDGKGVVDGRHAEFQEHHTLWRWLQDSLEGGQRYRDADYGWEVYTITYQVQDQETGRALNNYRSETLPRRNLIRHPQEYPVGPGLAGTGEYLGEGGASTGDEYEFRRVLTPVPSFVSEAIGAHLARIYAREVTRTPCPGPLGERLQAWWQDVDGSGTMIDQWMHEVVAPLFLVLGQLDLAFDRPPTEDDEPLSQAEVAARGLDRCVASYILPENLLDWGLETCQDYEWCVVREFEGDTSQFRKWTELGWTLYDARGELIDEGDHPYGCVPIIRCFDTRKPRCENVGQSKYEVVAELQRAYYNVDSELTLSNSLAAHPLLSGPMDLCGGDSIRVGPGNVLPQIRDQNGQYHGWTYVTPSSDAADKLRAKLQDYRDAADRAAALTKPAGARGSSGQTVAQSGVSKMLDQSVGNDLLTRLATSLERLELKAARMALTVLNGGPVDPAVLGQVQVAYPRKFDLFTASDFAALIGELQALVGGIEGELPELTAQMYRTYVRLMMPGLEDAQYQKLDDEFDAYLALKKEAADQRGESSAAAPPPAFPPLTPALIGAGPSTD